MIYICLYSSTGEVQMRTTVPDLATADRLSSDLALPYVPVGGTQADGYVQGGKLVPFPEKPNPTAVWSWVTHAWEQP